MVGSYVNKRIKVILPNNFFYIGIVKSQEDNKIIILDREGKQVELNLNLVVSVEVLG